MVDRIDSILGFETLKPKEVKLLFQCRRKCKKRDSDSGPFDSKAHVLRRKRKRRRVTLIQKVPFNTEMKRMKMRAIIVLWPTK